MLLKKGLGLLFHEKHTKIGINTAWLFVEKFFIVLSTLVITFLLPNYLNVAEFGLWNFAYAIFIVLMSINLMGMPGIIFNDLAENPKSVNELIGTSFFMILVASIVIIITITCLYFTLNKINNELLMILIMSLSLLFKPLHNFEQYFYALSKAKYPAISKIMGQLLVIIFVWTLIRLEKNYLLFAFIPLIESSFYGIGLTLFFHKKIKLSSLNFRVDLVKKLLKRSFPLFIQSLLIVLYLRVDQFFVMEILGEEQNGFYALSARLTEMFNFLPMILCTSFFPSIIQRRLKSISEYYKSLKLFYGFIICIGFIFGFVLFVFGDLILSVFFNDLYAQSLNSLKILAFSGIFVGLGLITSRWLIIENMQKYVVIGGILSLGANIILNIVLINPYGIEGVAFASIIAYFINSFGYLLMFKAPRNILKNIILQKIQINKFILFK